MKEILEADELAFEIKDILKNISKLRGNLLLLSTIFKISVYLWMQSKYFQVLVKKF
jgi:hypothetical protein